MARSTTNHYIELNGKRYNALTGEMMAHASHAAHATKGKVIDGFVRAAPSRPTAPALTKNTQKAAAPAPAAPAVAKTRPLMSDVKRGPATHAVRRPQEHSKTLMRKAVKKPVPSLKRTLKTQTRTDILAKVPQQQLVPKRSIASVDERRLKHAHQVAKSQMISRFGTIDLAPISQPAAAQTPTTTFIKETIKATPRTDIKPVYASSAAAPAIKFQPSLDIFEHALAHANSHTKTHAAPKKQLKHRAKRKRPGLRRTLASTGAAVLAVVLVAGFIAYQNSANIQMRIAASKAGIHASMPTYRPVGFAPTSFVYDTGAVAVDFHNTHDGRNFKVIQKASNWNSDTLANEYVASVAGDAYRTLQAGGRTVFAYGNNNATWVDSGIWYTVTTDGSLSSSQLLDLARSM